jgi:hypothetical protein
VTYEGKEQAERLFTAFTGAIVAAVTIFAGAICVTAFSFVVQC